MNVDSEIFDCIKVQHLISQYGNLSADEVIKQLMIEADWWLSSHHNSDDIALLVIKHK